MIRRIAIGVVVAVTCLFLLLVTGHKSEDEYPPLTRAILKHNIDEVKALLAAGANIAAADRYGEQAIHVAAGQDDAEALKLLIAAGAKVDAVDNMGNPPIIHAVGTGKTKSVNVLLAAGAKVDVLDKNGLQPIHLVAYRDYVDSRYVELAKTLLAAGAKVDALDRNGAQPLHWAARHGDPDMAKALLAAAQE